MSRKTQLLCVWTAPVLAVVFGTGCILVARVIPPHSPAASAVTIADWYKTHTTSIRIGCVLMIAGFGLFAPWGATLAVQTRRMESRPTITYTQIASLGATIVFLDFIPMIWALAAYRPGHISPQITLTLNDAGWFVFLFTWPPVTVWLLAIAVAIFRDESAERVFPRWAGYLNLWTALLFIPGSLMAFFKTGPFSYRGLITMYIPLTAFFVWFIIMTVLIIKAINSDTGVAPQGARAPRLEPVGTD